MVQKWRKTITLSLFLYCCCCFWIWSITAVAAADSDSSSSDDDDDDDDDVLSYPGGLYWNDVSVQTNDKNKFLVHNCHGFVEDGHLCAILGPSGAGKSSLLHALGGMVTMSSHLNVQGDIFLYDADQQTLETLKVDGGHIGWLGQYDHFFSQLTVKETLDLAAFLQLPNVSERQRQRRVRSTLSSLGLYSLQDRRIGESTNQRSLSGGEKRRLSLAVELVSSPALFFADEPTSGLDSSMAYKVIKLIKKMIQQRNIPCIMSIHQPQSSIFKLLDSLILLAPGGRVCYMGPASKATQYFGSLGFACPTQTNPAEFLLDLVSVDSEDPRQASEDEVRISRLAAAFAKDGKSQVLGEDPKVPSNFLPVLSPFRDVSESASTNTISQIVEDIVVHQHPNTEESDNHPTKTNILAKSVRIVHRFGLLLLRSMRQNIRDVKVNTIRLLASVGNAYLFSKIFQSIQSGLFTSKSVADRVALLTFAVVNMSMMSIMKTVNLFAKEKPVVIREQERHLYSSIEYLLSKSIAELPLDVAFAAIFTTALKHFTGLRISWEALTSSFSLMTLGAGSLGFAIGSWSPTSEVAMTAAMPVMIVLMMVGVINPSGVDSSQQTPVIVQGLQHVSPIAHAIKAVCIAEYRGGKFVDPMSGSSSRFRRWNIFARSKRILSDLPKMGALALVQNGDQVLDALGLSEETYTGNMNHLMMLSLGNLILSWVGLQLQARKNSSTTSVSTLSPSSPSSTEK